MSGPLQRRTGQNSCPLLATRRLQHTRVKSVNMHTHSQIEAYTAVMHTDTLSTGSFDMSSIHLASSVGTWGSSLYLCCRQVLDGGYWCGFTGWWERDGAKERGWQTYWISNRKEHGWHQSDSRPVFFAVATVKLKRKSGLLTCWCDRELLGVSVCASGRLAFCSCWRTRQEQMGTPKKRQTWEHHINNSQEHKCTIHWNQYKTYQSVLGTDSLYLIKLLRQCCVWTQ